MCLIKLNLAAKSQQNRRKWESIPAATGRQYTLDCSPLKSYNPRRHCRVSQQHVWPAELGGTSSERSGLNILVWNEPLMSPIWWAFSIRLLSDLAVQLIPQFRALIRSHWQLFKWLLIYRTQSVFNPFHPSNTLFDAGCHGWPLKARHVVHLDVQCDVLPVRWGHRKMTSAAYVFKFKPDIEVFISDSRPSQTRCHWKMIKARWFMHKHTKWE